MGRDRQLGVSWGRELAKRVGDTTTESGSKDDDADKFL